MARRKTLIGMQFITLGLETIARTTEEVITDRGSKKALNTTNLQRQEVKTPTFNSTGTVLTAVTSKEYLQGSRFPDLHTNSIPISGYTAFQQIDFCMVYFDVL